ncbi:hypothetical protein LCGC14_0477590 [marine sediment metagenome]|uniref:Uncharacterized protein n=1 Tax=marine sediment metagenome TaxID=412755 RepID=A0A0F9VJ27_9ZZZZ
MLSVNKKIWLIVLMSFFLVSSVSAALTFEQSKDINIKIVCINAGFCTAAAQCNASIFSPSEVVLLDGVEATPSSSLAFHNITLNSTQTSQLGTYRVGGFCKDGSVTQLIDFDFDVTANGEPFQEFPTAFIIIILGIVFIILGLFNEKFRLFKHMGSIVLMVMGVITLFPGYSFINWTTLTGKVMGFSLIALGFYFLIEDSFSRDEQDQRFTQEESGNDFE